MPAYYPSEFMFRLAFVSLSAKGAVALCLVAPVAMVLLSIAWRIIRTTLPRQRR